MCICEVSHVLFWNEGHEGRREAENARSEEKNFGVESSKRFQGVEDLGN